MSSKSKSSPNRQYQLKRILERLYGQYNRRELIAPDPLQFVYRYTRASDMEIVAFLASALAYGRVQQIEKSLTDLLERLGTAPARFVANFDSRKRKKLASFKHRFNTGDDISELFRLFKKVLKKHGSLENFFLTCYSSSHKNVLPALDKFCESLLGMHAAANKGRISGGLRYLLARPSSGSACKRLNLFLRWMIRDDDVDTGLWKSIDKKNLVVPLDTHMTRLCRILDLYQTKTASLKAAIEITESFAKIQPDDPVKYDFALSRIGIVEGCTGKYRPECQNCQLGQFCLLPGKS